MNGLSLFAGIGGLDLGLERAGITTVGQVEIDPWCRRVLAKHWPDVPRHDDVRTAADWWLSEERPHVDLIFGGFPCQDISSAGKKVGIRGDRSGLWFAFADVIRDLRPSWVLLENVSALLVRGLGDVLGSLAEIGYDAEWDCVPAAAIGAPHRRDRWFGIAYPKREQLRHQPVALVRRSHPAIPRDDGPQVAMADASSESGWLGSGWRQQQPASSQAAGHVANAAFPEWGTPESQSLAPPQRRATEPRERSRGCGSLGYWWTTEPDVGRVAHGVPGRVDRLRGLGNAVVPQVAEHVGCLIVAAERERAV